MPELEAGSGVTLARSGGILTISIAGGAVIPEQFGAVGDGVTNDGVALQAWLDSGGKLYLPGANYKCNSTLIVRRTINLSGNAYGFDDLRSPGGTLTPSARIIFPAGIAGFDIQPQVTTTTWPAGAATQEGAFNSTIEHIELVGGGGTAATGLHSRTTIHLKDVTVTGFSGKGFDISSAASTDATAEYGNASFSTLERCTAQSNGSHGFHIRGADAEVIRVSSCNSNNNGGWGFLDDAPIMNMYEACHTSVNTLGSYGATATTPFHSYLACYDENDTGKLTSLPTTCSIIGGNLANDVNHPSTSLAFVLNAGQAIRKAISGLNNINSTQVAAGLGRAPGSYTTGKISQWFGSSNDASGVMDDYKLQYEFVNTGIWAWQYRNALPFMEFPSGQTAFYATLTNPMSVGFPQGLAMGSINSAGRLLPGASAAPTSGTYRLGDTVPNSAPAASGKWGWVCVTAGSPGTWKAFGAIDA